jgi:subtilisin family serine protease
MIKRALFFLVILKFLSPTLCQPSDLPERISPEKAYAEGKQIFYSTLQEKASHFQLEEEDRKKLVDAQKRISGLYEHLMNFYFFKESGNPADDDIANDITGLSSSMAAELMDSIPPIRIKKGESPLESILLSIGFQARKSTPQFRKFLRPLTRRAKSQWMLKELEIQKAHKITKGSGVRIAIIDSGLDPTIKELRSQIAGWKNFLDRSNPFLNYGKFPYDWGGHGTSIATVVSQVAPDAETMIVKVFDQETMFYAPFTRWNVYLLAAGINWAVQKGADVISLSVALDKNYKEIKDASESCWNQNIILVSAAGNVENDESESDAYYPASYPWSVGVGGVEKKEGQLKVWEHSAKGYYIDVVAPAKEIWVESPSYLDRRSWPINVSGNSLAVPVVASTAALVLSAMDSDKKQALKNSPGALVEVVRSILKEGSSNKKLGYRSPNPVSGFGLINACQAVKRTQVFNKE